MADDADVSEQLYAELLRDDDDGAAVRESLAAGVPVYYAEEDTPDGLLVKEYPDGRKVLVQGFGPDEQVVRAA